MKKLSLIILTILAFSCKDNGTKKTTSDKVKTEVTQKQNIDKENSLLKNNILFIGDSLLNGNRAVINNYIEKYQPDSCGIIIYKDSSLKLKFEGVKIVDDINGDKKADSVFVVAPFNYCDDGESYCFFDKSLHRLYTDSYCCHPDNFFTLKDIDEDGILEIGIFYSTCVSRYKSLLIYSLKNGQWVEIASSTFDILTKDPTKVVYKNLVKKIRKNKFKICNFDEGKTIWKKVTMK